MANDAKCRVCCGKIFRNSAVIDCCICKCLCHKGCTGLKKHDFDQLCNLDAGKSHNWAAGVRIVNNEFMDYRPNSPANLVFNTFSYVNLSQRNEIPNNNNVFLDLVFSNIVGLEITRSIDPLTAIGHHHIPYCITLPTSSVELLNYECYYYDFKNANYSAMNKFLCSLDFVRILDNCNVNKACEILYDYLYKAVEIFVPVKLFKSSSFPTWFSGHLKHLVIQKKIAHKQYRVTGSQVDYLKFVSLRAQCAELEGQCYHSYIVKMENGLRDNPSRFWRHISALRSNSGYPAHLFLRNKIADTSQEAVELFADFFSSVYKLDDGLGEVPNYNFSNQVDFNKISITVQDVYNSLITLPDKFTLGPDGIPPYLLKRCVCALALPIHKIFNLSLDTGIFPVYWKNSYIVPIHKSGAREDISNYRGISIQSTLPKILDGMVTARLTFACRGLIGGQQHGFTPGRSTLTGLMVLQHDIVDAFGEFGQVDAIYTDFSKAFDRVNHRLLLAKLGAWGFGPIILAWVQSFLTGRSQCVRLNETLSREFSVPSGVPQGSHCGPLLFKLFTNDIGLDFQSNHLLFADDLKIYRVIHGPDDAGALQSDINTLCDWTKLNDLHLNAAKCSVISFSRSNNPLQFDYVLDSTPLNRVAKVRDLGVTLDAQLNFIEHIGNISSKGFKQLGFVLRHSRDFSSDTLKLLFLVFVRSHLEYCSVIWSPYYDSHINSIERIQSKFLIALSRKVGMYTDLNYQSKCDALGLEPLFIRRFQLDLMFFYKLMSGKIDAPDLLGQVCLNVPCRNHNIRSNYLFKVPYYRTNYGFYSPLSRMLRLYNLNSRFLDLSYSELKFRRLCRGDRLRHM